MKCGNCGSNLKRIAVDCYQCEFCGLKHKAALMSLPIKPEININTQELINNIEKEIFKKLGVAKRFFNK